MAGNQTEDRSWHRLRRCSRQTPRDSSLFAASWRRPGPEWKTLCAGCRAKEARYGFRPEGVEASGTERPRTLCFDCFRVEIDRRRRVAQQLAKGWNASQVGLPLDDTLNELSLRRRRAQIAARHALGLT